MEIIETTRGQAHGASTQHSKQIMETSVGTVLYHGHCSMKGNECCPY